MKQESGYTVILNLGVQIATRYIYYHTCACGKNEKKRPNSLYCSFAAILFTFFQELVNIGAAFFDRTFLKR